MAICIKEKCSGRANYNIKGKIAKYCPDHKKDGMISNSTSFCRHIKLKDQ